MVDEDVQLTSCSVTVGLRGYRRTLVEFSTWSICLNQRLAHMMCSTQSHFRHAGELNWEGMYCRMALGGTRKLVLGLHNKANFDGLQELSIDEVLMHTSRSSNVFFQNQQCPTRSKIYMG